jgi:hypothetical protein
MIDFTCPCFRFLRSIVAGNARYRSHGILICDLSFIFGFYWENELQLMLFSDISGHMLLYAFWESPRCPSRFSLFVMSYTVCHI